MEISEQADDVNKNNTLAKTNLLDGLFLLVVLLFIGIMLYSTISWMWDDERLPLSQFVLQGDFEYLESDDVQQVLASVDTLGTFMSQDVDELQYVVEELPWIAQASIRKQWPETVKIYVVEHRPSAIWNGTSMLNNEGDIFYADVSLVNTDELIKLYGMDSTSSLVLQTWREIVPKFTKLGLTISSVVLNDRQAWQLILENGIRLELGKDSLDERLERFFSLYNQLGQDSQKVSYIDLRYDTGAAIGWIESAEQADEDMTN
jgi:cell division protein FtsQ